MVDNYTVYRRWNLAGMVGLGTSFLGGLVTTAVGVTPLYERVLSFSSSPVKAGLEIAATSFVLGSIAVYFAEEYAVLDLEDRLPSLRRKREEGYPLVGEERRRIA